MAWVTQGYRRRNSLRAEGHDYRTPGAYLITVTVAGRARILSNIRCGRVTLSALGKLLQAAWTELPSWLPSVGIDGFVVMPDHWHGILWIEDPTLWAVPASASGPAAGGIGAAVGQLKSRVTKAAIAEGSWIAGNRLWQRGYHDRRLRSPEALRAARRYLALNPVRWARDRPG